MSAALQKLTEELFPRLVDSPQLLLQKLDPLGDRALLIVMNAEQYRRAPFLDDRLVDGATQGFWMANDALLRRIAARRPEHPPPRYIFHLGHCGSTLLSRLLSALCDCLPVREPPALRTLAELDRERGGPLAAVSPARWDELFEMTAYLCARVFPGEPAAIVKATSDCNNLIDAALRRDRGSRAVLLTLRLEAYLATMLRSTASRADVDGFARSRLADLHAAIGEFRWRLYELDAAERAAVSWLANALQLERARIAEPERTLQVDFDDFLADPASALCRIVAVLGFDVAPPAVERLLSGDIMNAYSKAPEHRYDAQARARELDAARAAHRGEISRALAWARRSIDETPALAGLASYLE